MEKFLKTFDLTVLDAQMIFVWALCFVIIWQVLAKLVFKPFLALVEARDAATTGAEAGANKIIEEAESLRLSFEDKMTEVRTAAVKEKLAKLAVARADAQKILESSEKEAQSQIAKAREELAQKLTKLRGELEKDADDMARTVVAKLKTSPEIRTH